MKSKIISSVLCVAVLFATAFMIYYSPSEAPSEETKESEENATLPSESDAVVTRAYVIEAAHDAEDVIHQLAFGAGKSYESEMNSLSLRLQKSADYLKDTLQDYYGASYFTKLSEVFSEITNSPFQSTSDFSSRAARILTEIENAYPAEAAAIQDENHPDTPMYYPKFDTSAGGSYSLALLCIFRQQYAASQNQILLTFGGNVAFGDTLLSSAADNSFKNELASMGGLYPLQNLSSILRTDDISFANLQAPLTTEMTTDNSDKIKGIPDYAKQIKNCGLDVLSISDPELIGYGENGKTDTIRALNEAEISFTDEGTICYVKTDLGIVAYLTYDIIEEIQGNVNLNYIEAPKQDIAAAREAGAAIVVVHFNWITTMKNSVAACTAQVQTTRSAIDNGADLVFGSHQGFSSSVEQYKGINIVYSAGNLFTKGTEDAPSFLVQQAFSLNEEGKAVPGEITFIPVGSTGGSNALPYLKLDSASANQLKNDLVSWSRSLRYGINKRNTFTTDHIQVISIEK